MGHTTLLDSMGPAEARRPANLQLPRSSTRNQKPYCHCKVITRISTKPMGLCFEGPVFAPGEVVPAEQFGPNPVVLECVGSIGPRRSAPVLWILWRWNRDEWQEVARSLALGSEWTEDLREPARRILYPDTSLYDLVARSAAVTNEILTAIEARLEPEGLPVKKTVLRCVYDRVAGRMVNLE